MTFLKNPKCKQKIFYFIFLELWLFLQLVKSKLSDPTIAPLFSSNVYIVYCVSSHSSQGSVISGCTVSTVLSKMKIELKL